MSKTVRKLALAIVCMLAGIIFGFILTGCAKKEQPTKSVQLYEPRPASDTYEPVPSDMPRDTVWRTMEHVNSVTLVDSAFKEMVDEGRRDRIVLLTIALQEVTKVSVGQQFNLDRLFYIQKKLANEFSADIEKLRIERRVSSKEYTQYYIFIDIPQSTGYYHTYICTSTQTNVVLTFETKHNESKQG